MERATEEECRAVEDRYLDQLEEIVRYSLPKGKSVAGFFAESIQGVGGSVQYPRGYLKRAFQVNCKLRVCSLTALGYWDIVPSLAEGAGAGRCVHL